MLKKFWMYYKRRDKFLRYTINNFLFFEVYFAVQIAVTIVFFAFGIRYSVLQGIGLAVISFVFLSFLYDYLVARAKDKLNQGFISFLSTFAGFYAINKNVMKSLKETCDFIDEPVKGIVLKNLLLYEKGQLAYEELFIRIADEIDIKSYRNFFMLLLTADTTGADITGITRRLIDTEQEKNRAMVQLRSSISYGLIMIFIMSIITLYMFNNALSTQQITEDITPATFVFVMSAVIFALLLGKVMSKWLEGE